MDRVEKVLAFVEKGMALLAGFLLFFIALSMCLSIALRTLGLQVPLWSVQFNEYSLLWLTFLGGAWLLRKGGHVSLDILTRRLRGTGLKRLQVLHAVMGLVICGLLAWFSGAVTWDLFVRGVMDVRAVDVPQYLILSIVFLGFLLMAIEFLVRLIVAAKRPENEG
ncbi:MAG: TRAP transporter small permease [Desulfatiglandaceae bacterium]|jgi:C4-dicarboxylate transporter, DctQ subunit